MSRDWSQKKKKKGREEEKDDSYRGKNMRKIRQVKKGQ
jgi:hypothetical protein